MIKKFTFLSTCLTSLKLMCSVNFSMMILLGHCILQNKLLEKIFKLTNYNSFVFLQTEENNKCLTVFQQNSILPPRQS